MQTSTFTSLDTEETSVNSPGSVSYQAIQRTSCSEEWTAAFELYRHLDRVEGKTRSDKLTKCCTNAWFVRHEETGHVRVVSHHCKQRWCPICAKSRSNFIRHEVSAWLKKSDSPKFVTFTVKHTVSSLSEQVIRLYDSFRRLRKTGFFNELATGGIWFFQVCRNTQKQEWHPHLHCIIEGKYIPYKKLRAAWLKITGDSNVVDIRTVKNPKTAADYIARYSARPCKLSGLRFELGIELITTFHGKRLSGTWGTGSIISLRPRPITDFGTWRRLGSWTVIIGTSRFSQVAKQILKSWSDDTPLPPDITMLGTDHFIDNIPSQINPSISIIRPPPQPSLF